MTYRTPEDHPTQAAITRLKALPMHPIRKRMSAMANYRVIAHADAPAHWVSKAEEAGFVRLGCASEGSNPELPKQVLIDADRTTQAHISSVRYFFSTYFESGACIITWDRVPITPSVGLLTSRAGKGDLREDYAAHVRAVATRLDGGEVPLRVPDIETAVALGDIFYRQIVPVGRATLVLMGRYTVPAIVVATIAYAILRVILRH